MYFALVHYPVRNKLGEEVTTAVTNLDLHDGSRLASTYGMDGYYLVSPIEEQADLILRIRDHWITGSGHLRNPERKDGMSRVHHAYSVQEVCDDIEARHHIRPLLVGTSAQVTAHQGITYEQLRQKRLNTAQPILLLFGTGWGLSSRITPPIDLFLPPIWGPTAYNHLSVRGAMAVILDRILGNREP